MLKRVKGKNVGSCFMDGEGFYIQQSSIDVCGIRIHQSVTGHLHGHFGGAKKGASPPPEGQVFTIGGEDAEYDTPRAMLDRVEVLLKEKGIEIIGETFDANESYIQHGKVVTPEPAKEG